jgi:methylated-DNA-[protein]-cysteine S-methyltransferase
MAPEMFYSLFQTGAGWMGILGSPEGLRRVILPRKSARELRELFDGIAVAVPDTFTELEERLTAYFSGRKVDFPDRLDLSGATPFQREVWQAARQITYGETRSYRWLALQISRPGAARAVGQALGSNPLPIIVPCHRVLASDGGLGGFSAGLEMKRLLLRLEGCPA